MFGTTPYRTSRVLCNDVSRLQAITVWITARALTEAKIDVYRQIAARPGDLRDAAPDRSSVPLGSGRFSAEQRGRAV